MSPLSQGLPCFCVGLEGTGVLLRIRWACCIPGQAVLALCVYLQGLSLVLSEGGLRDKEEKEPPMEEDVGETDALQGYQWLLRDLPRLPLFDSVRTSTALALQQVRNGQSQSWREGAVARSARIRLRHLHLLLRPSTWRLTPRPSAPTLSTCPSIHQWRSKAHTATWPW